jgi:hypothetical protein
MFVATLTFAFALLTVPSVTAVPEFVNHGTTAGFKIPKPEASGTVQQVSNLYYRSPDSPSALKMTQTYQGTGYDKRYHSEAYYDNGYHRGDTKFYGFAFRLSEDWQFSPAQSYNIGQWIADFGDTGCDDYSPTSMIWLNGTTLYSRVKTGQLLPGKPCPPENNKGDCSGGKNCQKVSCLRRNRMNDANIPEDSCFHPAA